MTRTHVPSPRGYARKSHAHRATRSAREQASDGYGGRRRLCEYPEYLQVPYAPAPGGPKQHHSEAFLCAVSVLRWRTPMDGAPMMARVLCCVCDSVALHQNPRVLPVTGGLPHWHPQHAWCGPGRSMLQGADTQCKTPAPIIGKSDADWTSSSSALSTSGWIRHEGAHTGMPSQTASATVCTLSFGSS